MFTASLNSETQTQPGVRRWRVPALRQTALGLAACLAWSLATLPLGAAPQPATGAEQVSQLVAVLNSGAAQKEKADACRELARLGTKEAIPALAALLADEQLSHMARYGLETIPDPAVDDALRAALNRLHGRPLAGVIGSLGVRRDPKAVEPLTSHLGDSDPDVVQATARALGKIATPAAAQALRHALPSAAPANQLACCEGLLRCADAFLAKGANSEAVALYDFLRTQPAPHQVRTAALRGAVLARKGSGLKLLLETLRRPDFTSFASAARISQEMPGARVTRALAGELKSLPADQQILLIQTLARRADAAAVPALVTAAQKCEKPVRIAALRALPEFGAAAPLPPLLAMLQDGDRDIARTAQESLAGLPGKKVDEAALALLASPDSARQLLALDLLARRRVTSAVPALFNTVAVAEPKVRTAAIKRLGELAGPAQVPNMLDCLAKSRTPEDLDALEQALGVLCVRTADHNACAAQLEARFAQADAAQKCLLLRVMTTLGSPKALSSVRAALRESDAQVHAAALRALGAWNTADTAPDLLELARNATNPTDKALGLRAYLAMAGRSELPEAQRLAMCGQAAELVQKDEEKRLLLGALNEVHSAAGLELIQRYLDDPAVKAEAGNAVVGLADRLLKGNDARQAADRLVPLLEKVAAGSANADLQKRANALLDQAKKLKQ